MRVRPPPPSFDTPVRPGAAALERAAGLLAAAAAAKSALGSMDRPNCAMVWDATAGWGAPDDAQPGGGAKMRAGGREWCGRAQPRQPARAHTPQGVRVVRGAGQRLEGCSGVVTQESRRCKRGKKKASGWGAGVISVYELHMAVSIPITAHAATPAPPPTSAHQHRRFYRHHAAACGAPWPRPWLCAAVPSATARPTLRKT